MYVYVVCNNSLARRRECAKPGNFHKIFYFSCCSILFVAVNALKEHISENWFDTNRHHPFVPQLRVAFVLTGGGYRAQVTGKYNWLDKSTAQLIGWLIDWLTNYFKVSQSLLERCIVMRHLVTSKIPFVFDRLVALVASNVASDGVHVQYMLEWSK